MGNCVKRKETVIMSNTVRLQVPLHTMTDDKEDAVTFRVDISHWKLRGLQVDTYFLKAWWASIEFETTEELGENLDWDCTWEFAYQTTLATLRDSNITIMLFSIHKTTPLSTIYIKQWDIATGPSLQNFALLDKKGKLLGRVSFNAHVRQETMLTIKPVQVNVSLNPDRKGRFSLGIKCVTEDSEETLALPVSQTRQWTFSEQAEGETQPILEFPATIETLRNASLQAKLWRHKKSEEQVLAAECWLSFSHIFKQEKYTVIKREAPGYKSFSAHRESEISVEGLSGKVTTYNVTRNYSERMTLSGQEVGELSGTLVLMNIPMISQLVSGVNTENGFMAQSSNYLENSVKTPKGNPKVTLPLEIQQIAAITEELGGIYSSGDQREASLFSSRTSDVRDQITRLKELCTLLRSTRKQSMISFIYESKGDLIQAQIILLDTGEHLLRFADVTPYAVRPFYYEALIHVLRRGELDLGSLSLTEEDQKLVSKKLPGALRYRSFLRSVLTAALTKMKVKGIDKKTQQFTEFTCAVSYFRVPEYRRAFLTIIQEKEIGVVPEWTNSQEIGDIQTHIFPMFDWQQLCYQFLPVAPEEDTKLRCVLEEVVWRRKVAKRGVVFFRLLAEWAAHVRRLFLDRNIPWGEIPGYTVLVRTFLWEMKTKNLHDYPAVLSLCSCSLLNNPALFSPLLHTLFPKTNLHSLDSISDGLELLNNWLFHLYETHGSLPITFDEAYFIEGLKLCLACDVGANVAKCIWVIYRNYQILPARTKEELVLKLLLGPFSSLWSHHWFRNVRQLYWSLIFYRCISFKFLPLDQSYTPLDEQIYSTAVDLANRYQSIHPEDLAYELEVYQPYSRAELLRVRDGYDKWLERVHIDLSGALGRTGRFGGLGVFPYPEITVEHVLMDRSENAIQEEW